MTYEQEILLDKYRGQRFDDDQLDEIKRGIEKGIDVEIYAFKDIDAKTMCKIRRQLQGKRDSIPKENTEAENIQEFEKIDETYAKREELLEDEHYERIFNAAITVGLLSFAGTLITLVMTFLKMFA